MVTYVLIRHEITNDAAYTQYRSLAGPSIKPHGGSVVAKGSTDVLLEGDERLRHMVLLAFPSNEAARNWFHSPEYTAAREARADAGEMVISLLQH